MALTGFDTLPNVDAATAAKLLGVSLAEFNRLCRDGVIAPLHVPLAGRRNAFSIAGIIAAYLKHLKDDGLSPATEMARHLDLSPQRLSKLVDEGTLKRPETNKGFDRDKTRVEYIRHLRKAKVGQGAGAANGSYAQARTQLTAVQTEAAAFRNELAKGGHVPVEMVDEVFARHAAIVRERVICLPSAAPELVGLEVEAIADKLRDLSFGVLDDLSSEKTWKR
jgi:phage terminase Nu1 subunit (DNA packaging protein)